MAKSQGLSGALTDHTLVLATRCGTCLEKGASAQDLTDIVRGKQAELLHYFCYLLGDPSFPEKELSELQWGLFEIDVDGNPIPPGISMLHESVLSTDPTGREMRPRKEAK